ncbi:MAG: DUF454 family protein [Gammaproteobacteria bacterium]|nr:MAG: DUF454 family protein [Gammaproteobacteria bacterium]
MKKIIYNTIGAASLSLGIVGAFLPLLPTTCFVLLATWAFAKSSPSIHAWLYYKSPFARSIQEWQEHRVIPTKVKWIATSSIVASYSLTLLFVENIYVLCGVGVGLLCLIAYLLSKPGNIQVVTYRQLPELHQPVI